MHLGGGNTVPFIAEEDVRAILKQSDEDARPVFRLAYETGLRRGELSRLAWGDVDMRRGLLTVRESKSKRSREIPLSALAADVLSAAFRKRTSVLREEPVFPHFHGRPHLLTRRFAEAARRADTPTLRLHDLRHGFGSRLAQAGVPIPTVQRLMGHATIVMTMRYAGHMPESAERDAIARADAVRTATMADAARA
jgi:integrase